VEEGVDLEHFTADLIEYLRKLILIKLGVETDGWQETNEQMYTQAKEVEAVRLLKIMDVFMSRLNDLKRAEISQLPLEMGVIELCEDSLNNYVPLAPQVVKTEAIKNQEKHPPATQAEPREALRAREKSKIEKEVSVSDVIPAQASPTELNNSGAAGSQEYPLLNKEGRGEVNSPTRPASAVVGESDENSKVKNKKQEALINLTLEEINNRWSEVIAASHEINQSAAIALQTAHPLNLKENNLEIGFEHSFYCERFKEIKARKVLEEILKKAFDLDFVVKCSVLPADRKAAAIKAREQKKEALSEPINMVLEDFGGVVVE
jgi:hypothetical protein